MSPTVSGPRSHGPADRYAFGFSREVAESPFGKVQPSCSRKSLANAGVGRNCHPGRFGCPLVQRPQGSTALAPEAGPLAEYLTSGGGQECPVGGDGWSV